MALAPAEQQIAAQRAGQGPPPPTPGIADAATASVAALAATAAASAAATAAPLAAVPAIADVAGTTLNAINTAAAGIISTFDRFLTGRRADQHEYVDELLRDEAPDLDDADRWQLIDAELQAEKSYAANVRLRLDRDLPRALAISDRAQRDAAVKAILERERRYQQLREDAIVTRALGAADKRSVQARSPEGAYWSLSDKVRTHTLDCVAMGGKVWPWSVLDVFHPPLCGPWCACELWTIDEARRAGKIHAGSFQTADQAATIVHIHEGLVDEDELDAEMVLLEAAYERRWSRGTTKAGQFRPRRGGDPGSALRLRRRHRMPAVHLPDRVAATPVTVVAQDTRALKVSELREGDQIEVNGQLERIVKVRSPGLVETEHTGLVFIDRETVQGVSAPLVPREPAAQKDAVAQLAAASAVAWESMARTGPKGSNFERLTFPDPETRGGKLSFVWSIGRHASKMRAVELNSVHSKSAAAKRRHAQAAIDAAIADVDKNIAQVTAQPEGPVREEALGELAGVRAALLEPAPVTKRPRPDRGDPAPPGVPTAGPGFDEVEKAAKMRRPADGAEILPGVRFDAALSRSETRDGVLYVPPGFFKLGRAPREKVLLRHYGRQLSESLGDQGIRRLGEQDPHLKSARAVVDTYYAINSDSRGIVSDVHPDAARLVATAALERGLPLHPEAAKLAREPAVADVPAPEHPVHDLAKRLRGMSGSESRDLLAEAGYQFTASEHVGGVTRARFRNHELGAEVTTESVDGSGYQVGTVIAEVVAPLDAAERDRLVGMNSRQMIEHLEAEGYAPNYTSVGDWMEFVHPDGRGRALRVRDTGPKMEVTAAGAFSPLPSQIAEARGVVMRSDPLAHIQAGDSFEPVRTALEYGGGMRWRMADSGNTPDLKLTAGATSFVEFRGRDSNDRIVLHLRNDTGGVTIVAAGHGSVDPAKRGRIVSAVERHSDVRARDEAERREADERKRAQDDATDAITAAASSGDAGALKAALAGLGPNEAVTLLRKHGLDLRGRRRSRQGGAPMITYTLRGQDGTTVKVAGPLRFGASTLDKVEIIGNPQKGNRTRLPDGQAPRNLNELLVDSLGRADELGARYGAGVHVTAIVEGGVSKGAAAHHEWNGTIAIRKSGEAKRIKAYLALRQKGATISDSDHLGFYNDVETLQHEINHGVAKAGDEAGGLSFGQKHYRGFGKNVEEALTEETGHLLAVEWLRSHGMTDVLAAVKRNPEDPRVKGVYRNYRVQVGRIFDDAGLGERERRDLLIRMKFQMTPEERNAELVRLSGFDNLVQALQHDPKRRSAMERAFQPVVRPDLSDVDATVQVETAAGRTISAGSDVMVVDGDGSTVAGEVVAIDGDMVKVRREDGLTLWTSITRVH